MHVWLRRCVIALVVAAAGLTVAGLTTAASVSFAQSPQGQPVQSPPAPQGPPASKNAAASEGLPGSQDVPASKPRKSNRVTQLSEVYREISNCLADDEEAVLFTDHVDCVPYREAAKYLENDQAPFDFNSERDCPRESSTNRPFNGRHLTGDAIKKLALRAQGKVGPHGVRIFRAIFCEKVDLVGLDLPFSLVLDKSVFNDGIEIRNLRINGDLSVDGSLVFKQLRIIRSSACLQLSRIIAEAS
jgi:hypothetical protein